MSDNKWVVGPGGSVTVETQVGAGRARVDVQPGQPLPDDVSEAEREQLLARGAIVADGRQAAEPTAAGEAPLTAPDGAPVVRPVPNVVEPDEINRDVIPGGSIEQVLDWVGDDLARARVALEAEHAKGLNARAELIGRLNQVKVAQEVEPAVPEVLNPDLGVTGGKVDTSTSAGEPAAVEADSTEPAGDEPAAPKKATARKSTGK